MSLWHYIGKFFNTNRFTLVLAVTWLLVSLLKYLKLPKIVAGKWLLWAILFLGLALRVAWLLYSSHRVQFVWNPAHMLENDLINVHAIDLTRGVWFVDEQGFPLARRPIGYPMFLGLLYKLLGVHAWVYKVSNLALFAGSAALVYGIAKGLFSERVGLMAAFLYSIYPTSIYSVAVITDEHLFLPLWYWGLYLLLKEINGSKWRGALIAYGLIFGYATMTRTHTIFMPFVVALVYGLMRKSWKNVAMAFVAVLFVMQLMNLPWVIRNYRIWGVPVLYTATAGNIYISFNENATPEGIGHMPVKGEPGYSEELDAAQKSTNSGLSHQLAARQMKRWMLAHPKDAFFLGLKRLIVFMGWDRKGVWPTWYQFYEGSYDSARPVSPQMKMLWEEGAYTFYYGLLFSFIFSCVYLGSRWKTLSQAQRTGLTMIAACFFFWFLEHMIIYPDRKYRFPLEPLMIVVAATFFDYLIFQFRWEEFMPRKR